MSERGVSTVRGKQLAVLDASIEPLVRAIAQATGAELVDRDADVVVVSARRPADLGPAFRAGARVVVVAPEVLRDREVQHLVSAGASVVLDRASSLLDLAAALADLLFSSSVEQRRHVRRAGGVPVRFWTDREPPRQGRMVGIAKSGAFVLTEKRLPEGIPLHMELALGERRARVRGRVAYMGDEGFGLEFALEHEAVAPSLAELTPG